MPARKDKNKGTWYASFYYEKGQERQRIILPLLC